MNMDKQTYMTCPLFANINYSIVRLFEFDLCEVVNSIGIHIGL